jgi:serine phosphatase RsbU (regulator of sigma subunit)
MERFKLKIPKKWWEVFSRWKSKLLMLGSFFLVFCILVYSNQLNAPFLDYVSSLPPDVKNNEIFSLEAFKLDFYECELANAPVHEECRDLNDLAPTKLDRPYSFPLSPQDVEDLEPFLQSANRVILTHAMDPAWLPLAEKQKFVVVVAPRSVQKDGLLRWGSFQSFSGGYGTALVFFVPSKALLEQEPLRIDLRIPKKVPFGPWTDPISLTSSKHWEALISTHRILTVAQHFSIQRDLGLSLLVVLVAIVLDHSSVVGVSSAYAVARSLRAFMASFLTFGSFKSLGFLFLTYSLVNALIGVCVCVFCMQISNLNFLKKRTWILFTLMVWILQSSYLYFKYESNLTDSFVVMDLLSDAVASAVGLLILGVGLGVFWKRRVREKSSGSPLKSQAGGHLVPAPSEFESLSAIWFVTRLLVLAVGLILTFFANFEESLALFAGENKSPLDWRHTVSMPVMVSVALIHVGSITRKIRMVAQRESAMAVMANEVNMAKVMQQRTLPEFKWSEPGVKWKSYYRPATALAGDWFDIKVLRFQGKTQFVVGVVVDITGHGVGPALVTSVLCSQWNLWIAGLEDHVHLETSDLKENLLSRAMLHMHLGLTSLKKGDACTAAGFIYELEKKEMTFITCGHPGFLMQSREDGSVKYLRTMGHALGATSGSEGKDLSHWPSQTAKVPHTFLLCAYSDGLLPLDVPMTTWLKNIEKQGRKEKADISKLLLKQMRQNRQLFRSDESLADDITLLFLFC